MNITLTNAVLELSEACMADRVIHNRSEYLATLIREDYERRGRPGSATASSPA